MQTLGKSHSLCGGNQDREDRWGLPHPRRRKASTRGPRLFASEEREVSTTPDIQGRIFRISSKHVPITGNHV